MSSARARILKSEISDFFKRNGKVVVSVLAVFVVGIVLGVTLAYRAVGGEFESVARVDADTGAGKMFFLSLLVLAASYGLILLSGLNKKTVFICCVPFFVIGYLLGRFSCALICRYEMFGLLNFLFVYLPVFIISVIMLVIASAVVLSASCTECNGKNSLKPSFVNLLKLFALNAAALFAFYIIAGLIVGGVIVPSLF